MAKGGGREKKRCAWAQGDQVPYHDREWGVPLRDDRALFELLILEGAQAGLSWATILRKREAYRRAFAGFDPAKVARFTARDAARLLRDPGIVRNRAKVRATIGNARAVLEIQHEHGSLAKYLWKFVGGQPVQNRWRARRQLPALTPVSQAMSRELLARGFRFVGPTICYAFMQAAGMVNDHTMDCFRWAPLARRRGRLSKAAGK
ncbi:MAG TPA: DNA-3-methyladenine glycosylase I [Methylomirabilota bacterium]